MFFLVRHAIHALGTGVLAGWTPGVGLTDKGHAQAARLAGRLAGEPITSVHSSPRQRTLETANAIAKRCGVALEVIDALDEVNFGGWAGKTFEELDLDPAWAVWNAARDSASTPAGQSIADLAARVVGHIERCASTAPGGRIVLVSHAEPIRTAILHYLGLAFSAYARIVVDPASISRLEIAEGGPRISSLNETVAA